MGVQRVIEVCMEKSKRRQIHGHSTRFYKQENSRFIAKLVFTDRPENSYKMDIRYIPGQITSILGSSLLFSRSNQFYK